MEKISILSLFANIGVAEAYLKKMGISVDVANELHEDRANLYSKIYPETKMIIGDIEKETIYSSIVEESKRAGVNVILATPPCQGVSTVGRQNPNDPRNRLILPILRMIHDLNPLYAVIENVPLYMDAEIDYNKKRMTIRDIIEADLKKSYNFEYKVINTDEYGIPQSRERVIIIISKYGQPRWIFPEKEKNKKTMRDAIGDLPTLDPYVKDLSTKEFKKIFPLYEKRKEQALRISKWHIPPEHIWRQVNAMRHTPSGCSAYDNDPKYRPVKKDGTFVKGFKNTYKRQCWDIPAFTVTMDNRKISSQNNVHPGRPDGVDEDGNPIYSDARVLTVYEIMKIMSIPDDWPLPDDVNLPFLRYKIGEGIPPLFI